MERDKALSLLSLARKGRRVEVGEIPVGACTRADKAQLVLLASDAGEHTVRRVKNFVAGTGQPLLQVGYDKDTLGAAVGYSAISVCALTDPALALNFVRALPPEAQDPALTEALETRAQKARRRQAEQKAHRANVRHGKKKS